jgi:hypothetical protein
LVTGRINDGAKHRGGGRGESGTTIKRRDLVDPRAPAAGRINDGVERQEGGREAGRVIKRWVDLDEEVAGVDR